MLYFSHFLSPVKLEREINFEALWLCARQNQIKDNPNNCIIMTVQSNEKFSERYILAFSVQCIIVYSVSVKNRTVVKNWNLLLFKDAFHIKKRKPVIIP